MRIEQLLEKNQQLQVAILKALILSEGVLATNQLAKNIGLSKISLEQYLQDVTDLGATTGFNLTRNGAMVYLTMRLP